MGAHRIRLLPNTLHHRLQLELNTSMTQRCRWSVRWTVALTVANDPKTCVRARGQIACRQAETFCSARRREGRSQSDCAWIPAQSLSICSATQHSDNRYKWRAKFSC